MERQGYRVALMAFRFGLKVCDIRGGFDGFGGSVVRWLGGFSRVGERRIL